jgi:hypothetical protein
MGIFSRLVIGYLIIKVFKYMFDLFDTPLKKENAEPRKYEIDYYSNGVKLNQPFHLEYRFILNAMEREKEYEMKYRKILIEYPNEPIFDVEVQSPIFRAYSYTYNHVYLAKSYLEIRKEYLENLS